MYVVMTILMCTQLSLIVCFVVEILELENHNLKLGSMGKVCAYQAWITQFKHGFGDEDVGGSCSMLPLLSSTLAT